MKEAHAERPPGKAGRRRGGGRGKRSVKGEDADNASGVGGGIGPMRLICPMACSMPYASSFAEEDYASGASEA